VSKHEAAALLKSQLRFTWDPLFARFGAFTPVQLEAIPHVLAGEDCLIASRTASGKTEAAAAPLVERLKREKWVGLSILYISPTRALVNDLFRRLEPRLVELGITIRPRTADSPHINEHAPPSIIITTPESFDAMLMRTPRMFAKVRAVVLDEIHLLDNTARGDGLRLSIHRLRALRHNAFGRQDAPTDAVQTVALSATISEPYEAASRYCLNARVIKVAGKRRIDAELRPMNSVGALKAVINEFRERGVRKALVFCGSRSETEELAYRIKQGPSGVAANNSDPFGGNIFVHHASLDRKVRIETETRFVEATVGICFATSTLELGVDIGDIDLVILVGAPYSVGSFLQRIGRGNRRTSRTAVLGFYRNSREHHLFKVLLACAESGTQDESIYTFRPSVIVQQLLSYLKQNPDGALTPRHLRVLMDAPQSGTSLLPNSEESALVEHLTDIAILRHVGRRGELAQGAGASELYEKHAVNANIEQTGGPTLTVVDSFTGRPLGEIQERNLRTKDSFAFGGTKLDVVRGEGRALVVDTSSQSGPMRKLRYSSRGPALPFDLAQRIGERAGLQVGEMPAFRTQGKWFVIHALGAIYGHLLTICLKREFDWNSKAEGIFLKSGERPPLGLKLSVDENVAIEIVHAQYRKFEKMLGLGKFQSYLPTSLRCKAVERACFIPRFCDVIRGSALVEVADRKTRDRLSELM
jgi:ATP-dependent Lhr-like helicase